MPTTLEQLQYGFDRDSRRTWRQRATTQGWDNAYLYDSLSRVTGDDRGDLNLAQSAIAGVPSQGSRWDYDETGNWQGYQTTANGSATLNQQRTHDKGNRLMEVSGADQMRTDRAGRMVELVPETDGNWNGRWFVTWDAWSRIVAAESFIIGIVAYYQYDGLARRITKDVNMSAIQLRHCYYNDEWRPLEERKGSETTANVSFLWGSRHRDDLVRRDRAVGGMTLDETRYILMDYFSPAAITDEAGAVKERYQFSAFGLRTILNPDYTVRSSSECALEFSFQGQFEDTETGWMNYGYRYYLPHLGRWTCKDPIGEQGGLNVFEFCINSPLNFVDYLGLEDALPIDWGETKTSKGNCWRFACDDKMKPGERHSTIPPGWFPDPSSVTNQCNRLINGLKSAGVGKEPDIVDGKQCCLDKEFRLVSVQTSVQKKPRDEKGNVTGPPQSDYHFEYQGPSGGWFEKRGFHAPKRSDGKGDNEDGKNDGYKECGKLCIKQGTDTDRYQPF